MKMKRLLGVLLTIVLMLGLLPGMGFTAYADVPQEGSNKYVGYRHNDDGFIVYGKREKADGTIEEIQTTWNNSGYRTVMKVGESESKYNFTGFAYGKEYIYNDVKASVTARVRGKGVLVTYTLFNDSDELKKVKIGSYADTQIYNDDEAPCSFTENGIKMTTVDGTLEFQLIPGGGNFTTRWYGSFSEAIDNVFNNRTDTSTYTEDSGIAWSWTIDIPARATITKTAELSAGQVGTTQIIYDANGGTGEMDPTVDIPGESIKLNKNTFTKDDYVFQGWDTNSAGTTVVYADEATLTMPDTDTTLYAVWKANANAVPATVTANNRTYDGAEKPLVTVTGEATGGTMQYALGTKDAATQPYTTSIPTATNAGTYYVWYRVVGDKNYKDKDPAKVKVTIARAASSFTAPKARSLTYTGKGQELVTAGKANGGTMQYALGTATKATQPYTTSIPTATKAGTYYVWYKAKGDSNHIDSATASVIVTIAEKKPEVPADPATPGETEAPAAPDNPKDEAAPAKIQANASIQLNADFLVYWKGSTVCVKWGKTPEADQFEIYAQYCGRKTCKKIMTVKSGNSVSFKRLNGKKLNRKRIVKVYVVASKNGKEIGRTLLGHAAGSRNSHTNAKKVKVSKKSYTLAVGKSAKIKAKIVKAKSGKKLPGKGHCAKLRYTSSNTKVATVSKSGKIKAVGKGKCDIRIFAQNGRSCKVTVTVK